MCVLHFYPPLFIGALSMFESRVRSRFGNSAGGRSSRQGPRRQRDPRTCPRVLPLIPGALSSLTAGKRAVKGPRVHQTLGDHQRDSLFNFFFFSCFIIVSNTRVSLRHPSNLTAQHLLNGALLLIVNFYLHAKREERETFGQNNNRQATGDQGRPAIWNACSRPRQVRFLAGQVPLTGVRFWCGCPARGDQRDSRLKATRRISFALSCIGAFLIVHLPRGGQFH